MTTVIKATEKFLRTIEPARLELAELEKEFRFLVVNARLNAHHGNQVRAARSLGIHRNSLARIIADMESSGKLYTALQRTGRPRRKRPPAVATVLRDPMIFTRLAGNR
jgi:hypothetical protein